MESKYNLIYEAILKRAKEKFPEIRYINWDFGQLDDYELRPPVTFPCILIEMGDFEFESMANNAQVGIGQVIFKLAVNPFSDTSSLTDGMVRKKGLEFNELSFKVNKFIHGWADGNFGPMDRVSDKPTKREDELRVREMAYAVSFQDNSACPVLSTTNKPISITTTLANLNS